MRPLWKNNGKLQNSQAKKVVAVAYESFYYRALTGKILVFWIGGRLREVVAHGVSTVGAKSAKKTTFPSNATTAN